MKLNAELPILKKVAINQAARKKLLNFFTGLAEYAAAKIDVWRPDAEVIWQEGTTQVLDYGGKGRVVLVIPPLINRANILDFGKDSLVLHLKNAGYKVLLVNWQEPSNLEQNFDSNSYSARLERFAKTLKLKPIIIGYCMGGILAMKLAIATKPKALALLATPYEFRNTLTMPLKFYEDSLAKMQFIPPEFISMLFAQADLFSVYDKFSEVTAMPAAKKAQFFAIEHWVNNGVPMTVPLMREVIFNWLQSKMGFNPADIKCKTLVVCASNDKIVPLSSSLPLLGLIDDASLLKLPSGHVGIITKKLIHKPLVQWLDGLGQG